jgi:hypothetical protein
MVLSLLVAGILYIVLGQLTVRKLRRNPATRHCLGVEFPYSGEIGNVAQAFGWPGWLQQRAERGGLCFMVAHSRILRQHTTRLDRALARACFWSVMLSGTLVLTYCLIVRLG